mmetsp:Transcript_10959/g.22338  ORF Transcript_10959/g.22338 Transcript_10959/m.22338 type:complete len:87 (+) Transcript_10959:1692-1952(+)
MINISDLRMFHFYEGRDWLCQLATHSLGGAVSYHGTALIHDMSSREIYGTSMITNSCYSYSVESTSYSRQQCMHASTTVAQKMPAG